MPATLKYGITYPAGTVAPNVPVDLQALAQSVEAALDNLPFAKGVVGSKATSGTGSIITAGTWVMMDLVAVPLVAGRWYEIRYSFTDSTTSAGVSNQPYSTSFRTSATTDGTATGTDIPDGGGTLWTAPVGASGNWQEVAATFQATTTGTLNIKACLAKAVANNQINISGRNLSVRDLGKWLP